MKKLITIILITLSVSVFGQVTKEVIDGKEYIIHTVKEKETLYRISKNYNVSKKEIRIANPELGWFTKEGQILKIPTGFTDENIHVIENRYVNRVSKYVAKGSQKWITSKRYKSDGNNTQICINNLKEKGYQIIGTSPHYDSSLLQDFDFTKKSAFVFGAEAEGISDTIKEQADGFLKIPMVGFTESLNISVAAAIILQDVTTKLRNSDLNWQLTEVEKEDLYFNWVKKTIKNVQKIEEHYYQKKE